jgi:putative ABC transport system permease protein
VLRTEPFLFCSNRVLLIGIFGATFGLVAGIGMGYALSATFSSDSSDDSSSEETGETSTTSSDESSTTPICLAQDMAGVWAISVSLSVLAGLFPAWKASRYLPVEALRSQ